MSDVSEDFFGVAMILDSELVSATEFAFVAGVTDRDVNRLVDERILPDFLVKTENGRRFDLSGAALAAFYFESGDVLTASARKSVIQEVASRIKVIVDGGAVSALYTQMAIDLFDSPRPIWKTIDLHVDWRFTQINMEPFFVAADERAMVAARVNRTIVSDPEILGGEPVFANTRVPVDSVLGSLDEGMSLEDLRTAWTFLNKSLIDDARLYVDLHPRRGRPRGSNSMGTDWKLLSRKVIPSADSGE